MNITVTAGAETRQQLPMSENVAWTSWKWQQQNAITNVEALVNVFPELKDSPLLARISERLDGRKLGITPYYADLIRSGINGQPIDKDPLWLQVVPAWTDASTGELSYDGETDNWELPHEMVTPICQHKYDNRVIIRVSNICHAYCQFCYEALRTLETETDKGKFRKSDWAATLDYIASHPELDEAIVSGGEPLMHADAQLRAMLEDLRALRPELVIRLHTRALSFNPFRVTDELLAALRETRVTAVGLHVAHPREITPEFIAAVAKLRQAVPLLFANIPLLAGVNDELDVMKPLCLALYRHGVLPHYLYQFMPFSPGDTQFCTDISKGVAIIKQMKRRISNMAVPELVLPHRTGKYSVPLSLSGESPKLEVRDGREFVTFRNWKDELCVFPG
ncbi:KamA family radical SAM protein [Azohydromonas lata]|uniref:KamA family radical SAM protein n=1 Tax=Azohydromonas lata TaxID=45677 RepID=A0ABU5IS00_9BURK|nr:KamA family radical SAM protein [Azohydromonas lata]MDZ5461682.1 KamA family radical SAM protein [Azohydromonas lata]